jgi:integrase
MMAKNESFLYKQFYPFFMAKVRIDIHDYDGRVRREKELLLQSALSKDNKALLLEYCRMLFLSGMSQPRLEKELITLRMFAQRLNADVKTAPAASLKCVIEEIRADPNYSVYTKSDYAKIVKKFYRWIEYGDEWRATKDIPSRVSWICGHVKKKDQPRLQRADMLTEEEAHCLIEAADSPRDKALLAILWDTGARIGEIGSLHVGSITFAEAGTHIDLNGKTGQRTPFVIECTPHLVRWLAIHPKRDNPNAPLWIASNNGTWLPDEAMTYNGLVKFIQRAFKKTGIKKGWNPHLFRHSRATWCATNGWTPLEMCKFFGWTPESTMPAYYTSLVNEDVEARMRKCYGLENSQDKALEQRKPQSCQRCQAVNGADQRYCFRCGMALTIRAAQEAQTRREVSDDALNKLAQTPAGLKDLVAALVKHGVIPAPANK